MEGLDEIKKLLEECDQSHILKYWDDISEEQQKEFLGQLKSIDIKGALSIWAKAQEDYENQPMFFEDEIAPVEVQVERDLPHSVIDDYRSTGLEEIANGRVAVIVLAGGQGTRLGMPYPKGMCPTGIPSGKTLFQLQAERIHRLMQIAKEQKGKDGIIHWYIMTSEATDSLTEKYLRQNEFLNLGYHNVTLFKQSEIPCFDLEGKILMEEKDGVAMAPDGNGGIYKALRDNGILEDMENKGIKYVHVHSVDNILIKVADPVFIGKCVRDNVDCGLKVIKKLYPEEPLGLILSVSNEIKVVEYSEICSTVTTKACSESGDFEYNVGNICNHFFTVDFLKTVALKHETDLKLHMAKKINTQIGPDGDKIRPSIPNCIKIEKFIFDVIVYSSNLLLWQVERSQEFSPVKNSDICGKDCFSTAKIDLLALHKIWVENSGGKCQGRGVEVSPLLSYEGEGLGKVKGREFREEEVIMSEEEEKLQGKEG